MPFTGDMDYQIEGIHYDKNTVMGPVYHNTQIKHLVESNQNTSQESSGIFRDGGFFWGTCTHNLKSGVNFNAGDNGGAWTFNGIPSRTAKDTWIAIECYVTAGSKLRGGAAHRYCITRKEREETYGPICPFIGISAILIPIHEVPQCVRLT